MAKQKEFTALPELPKTSKFYEVRLDTGELCLAEWCMRDRRQGRVWWKYTSPDPTVEKTPQLLEGVVAWRHPEPGAVENHLRRELTPEEKIEGAFDRLRYKDGYGAPNNEDPAPPVTRLVQPGDVVEVDGLCDCTVVAVRAEGRYIVLQHKPTSEGPLELIGKFWSHVRRPGLSEEELVEDAYLTRQQLKPRQSHKPDVAPPAARQFKLGDAVKIEGHAACSVAGLREDGKYVIVTHGKGDNRSLADRVHYRCLHWTEVLPSVQPEVDVQVQRKRSSRSGTGFAVLHKLVSRISRGELVTGPDFDRGNVWSDEDKARYLETLFARRDLGRIVLAYESQERAVIVDGAQRLQCLWEFFTDQRPYKGVFWHQLTDAARESLDFRYISETYLWSHEADHAELLRVYLELNGTGVPVSEAQMQKVRDRLLEEEAKASSVPVLVA